MAKFIKGNELNSEIEKIIYDAEKQLILISPYIKLHDRYSSALLTKLNEPEFEITIFIFALNVKLFFVFFTYFVYKRNRSN